MKKKILKLIMSSFFILSIIEPFAQTVLINPSLDGGFENGSSMALNNWTVVNSSTNTWRASGVSIPYQGSNAAFISANSGVDYVYNTGTFQTSHFYRDVTVPVGENLIRLNFYYKNPGEFMFDRLLVYTAPTSFTPIAYEPVSDVSSLLGATLVFEDLAQVNGYINVSVELPQALAGTTFRLIFTWQNDGIDGSGIPASIDNIGLTSEISQYGQPLNGNYTINNLLPTSGAVPIPGSNFNNFSDAISYLNMYGKSGDVRFDVTAGQIFNHGPLILTVGGSVTDTIGFIKYGNGPNPKINFSGGTSATDGGFTLSGVDYISVNGIDMSTEQIPSTSTLNIEYVIKVLNASATNGSQYNVFKNCTLTQNQLFSQNIAILQSTSVAPTTVDGTSSNNTYENLTIDNALNGIRINSNATNRDQNVIIKSCNLGSMGIGSMGNAASAAYGIYAINASSISVLSNRITNLSSPGGTANALDGIFLSGVNGLNTVRGNTISAIRNTSNSICVVSGIRSVVAANGSVNIFNNFISDLSTALTTIDAAIRIKGLSIQPLSAVSNTSVYNVDFNSVSLSPAGSTNVSNACIEVIQPGPIVNIRNNNFANFTPSQSGLPFHYGIVVPNLTIAAAGSISNYNNIFINQASNGVAVRKSVATAAEYATVALWNTASTLDAQSISADPIFINNNSDLHAFASVIDGAGSFSGITWIQDDIDGQIRSLVTPDIGADEFTLVNLDVALVAFVSPIFDNCFSSTETVTVRIRNFALSAHDFYLNPVQFNLTVGGANPTSLSITISDNNLNGNLPLGSLQYLNIPIGSINMSVFGNYNFACDLVMLGDEDPTNNSIAGYNLVNALPITYPEQVPFEGFTGVNLVTVFPNWNESSVIGLVTGSSQWLSSNGLGSAGNKTASYNFNTGNNPALIVGPKLIPEFNTFLSFEFALTEAFANFGTGNFDADDEFSVLISTDCGFSFQPILTLSQGDLNAGQLALIEILLSSYQGMEIIPAFYVNDGTINGTSFNFHLDNINLYNSTQEKIELMAIEAPVQENCFSSEEIIVRIKNTGYSQIDFSTSPLDILADLSGPLMQNSVMQVQSGVLPIGSELVVTMNDLFDLSNFGQYLLKINTNLNTTAGIYADSISNYLFSQNPSIVFNNPDTTCFNSNVSLQITSSVNGITNTNLPTFIYTGLPVAIPDGSAVGIDIPITVSGTAGFTGQLVSVEIDSVVHGNVTHLSFELIAPNGSSILLTNNNIGAGSGFYNTEFSMNSIVPISTASAPFTGIYLPEESFYTLNGDANGVWHLRVADLSSGEAGVLHKWSLVLKEANYVNTYVWSSQNSLITSDQNSALYTIQNNSYIVYQMTDVMGCSASDSVQIFYPIFEDLASVVTYPTCFGGSNGSVSVVLTGAIGEVSYAWQNPGLLTDTSNISNLTAGTYDLIATDAFGCSAEFQYILMSPSELFATSNGSDITCAGCTSIITVTATGGTPPYTGVGDFEVTQAGVYDYTVTDANGCSVNTSITILETSSISELEFFGVKVYPNPFESEFVIEGNLLHISKLNIEVFDQFGRNIPISTQVDKRGLVVWTKDAEPGIYYLKMSDPSFGEIFTHKLVSKGK